MLAGLLQPVIRYARTWFLLLLLLLLLCVTSYCMAMTF
jgi:cbb3-type cytochrome oxidase subunit 3